MSTMMCQNVMCQLFSELGLIIDLEENVNRQIFI